MLRHMAQKPPTTASPCARWPTAGTSVTCTPAGPEPGAGTNTSHAPAAKAASPVPNATRETASDACADPGSHEPVHEDSEPVFEIASKANAAPTVTATAPKPPVIQPAVRRSGGGSDTTTGFGGGAGAGASGSASR